MCAPRTCAAYSGANFVLLGLVLVNLDASVEWQDMNQRDVIPKALRHRYQHTSFLRLGRCAREESKEAGAPRALLPDRDQPAGGVARLGEFLDNLRRAVWG